MNHGIRLLAVLALALASVHFTRGIAQEAGAPEEGVLTADKVPVPTADERKAAQKKVREVLATDFKQAKTPEQRWQLALKLGKEAAAIKDDPDSEYAFAMEAIDLYVAVGDALSAFRTVDELAVTFDLNPITTKVALFQKAAKDAKAVPLKRMMALVGLKLAGDAAAAEDYEAAKTVAALSLTAAKPSRDASVIKRATDQQGRYVDLLKQWQSVLEARVKLKSDANDPDANQTVGRYLCLTRQNWDEGLPLMAKGSDAEVKVVADFDIKTQAEALSQAATASAWWDVAEKRKGLEKQQILPRVAYWYEKALPGLSGLSKATAEKRLEAAYEAMSGRSFAKIVAEPANGIQSMGSVDCSASTHPASLAKGFDYRRSWLLSFQFSPPHLRAYPKTPVALRQMKAHAKCNNCR